MNWGSMVSWKARGLGFGLLAGASMLGATPAWAEPTPDPTDYTALILGHAFLSQPDATYEQEVISTYVDNPANFGQPMYNIVGNPVSVYTPETDYSSGLTQGVTDLNNAIEAQLGATTPNPDLVIAGYSMSTSVITQEMINLAATTGGAPDTDGLKFVLAEDVNNPDGGIFTRFPGMFGVTLPATPADTPYDTTVYTIEYSGASDFPQYYGNLYADMNAMDGYVDLHPYLLPGWPPYFDPSTVSSAVLNPNVSAADTNTEFFLIPTQNLPLLDGLHAIGGHSAYVDMVQPEMRVLVDLGYNWTGNADVSTPATLTNPDIDFTAVNDYLDAGANQGMLAGLVDLGLLPQSDLADIANLYPYVPDVSGLMDGALNNDTLAAADASMSSAALAEALAGSTNPVIVEFGSLFTQMAASTADFYQMLASSL